MKMPEHEAELQTSEILYDCGGLRDPWGEECWFKQVKRMAEVEVIDIFPDFLYGGPEPMRNPSDDQIDGWANEYLSCLPELLEKQIAIMPNKTLIGDRLRLKGFFPFLDERLSIMQEARKNLMEACSSMYSKAQQVF